MTKLVLKSGSRPPWVGLAAAVWVQMASGSSSTFPLYSAALKSVLGFNQQQLSILGVANDFGENVGLLPGYASNKLPPWAVLLVGTVVCFLGFGVIWLAVNETVQGLPFWLLFLALIVGTNSNSWFVSAVLVTNMRNFPLSRGTVSGILKGYSGISGAAFTVLYSMVLHHSASNLLLFLTVGIPLMCLAVMYFVRACTPASREDSTEHVHFTFVQATSVLLAIYLLSTTILSEVVTFTIALKYVLITVMVFLLMSPLAIPIKMTLFRENTKSSIPIAGSSDNLAQEEGEAAQKEPLLTPSSSASYLGSLFEGEDASDMEILLAEGEGAVKKKRKPKRGEDFKLGEAFVKADFWLLWFVFFLGMGSGVTVTNNLAQIGLAFGVKDTTILLSLFSFCNFAGRLASGAISEHFVRSRTIPRTFWMGIAQAVMVFSFILFAMSLKHTIYFATAFMGICTGFQFLAVSTVSELFGLKHFGINYNFILLGNPIGATIFSALLAGQVYDAEAEKQGTDICIGPSCFQLTFLVLAGVCGMGTLLSVILTIRIRPVYQSLYASGSFRLPQSSNH